MTTERRVLGRAGLSPERRHHASLAADSSVQLTLLGNWSLSIGGESVSLGWSAQRLLVLLALRGRQRRTYLAGTLWPDTTDDQALTRLRSMLWRLRRQSPLLLEVEEQTVALDKSVQVDVDDLVGVSRQVLDGLVDASSLTDCYRTLVGARELLLGWYDEWVLQERERLMNLRIHALENLVDELIAAGRHAEAVESALAAVQLDSLRESTHRALIKAYLAEGNPVSARREVERYRSLLRSELGVDDPTPLMLELIDHAYTSTAPGTDAALSSS